jgi:hypothetical protein
MRHASAIAGFAAVLIAAGPAHGQSTRFYFGAGAISDDDRTNSRLTERPAGSWTFVAGFDFETYAGIRLLIDGPREVRSSSDWFPATREPGVWARVTRTRRSMTYGGLVDLHGQVTPRVKLAGTFGLVTVTHDEDLVLFREERRPDGTVSPLPDERHPGEFPWTGMSLGLEAPIVLMRRLEVVPEIRMIYFVISDSPRPYILRSGVGARWRF